jgi:hypothetical protein
MNTPQTTGASAPLTPLAAALAAGGPPRVDFPAWLPPMLVKELRQGLRTRGFVATLIVFQAVMAITFMWALSTDDSSGVSTAEGFFWGLMGVVLLLVVPMRALAGLRSELDTKTIDLLLLTRLTAWRIVLGKWVSLMMQALLLVATLLPYAVVRYFFGSVDLLRDFGVMAVMTLGCALLSAGALWASGLPKLLRVVLLVAALLGVPNLLGVLFARSMGGPAFGGGPMDSWQIWTVLLTTAAVGIYFCLVLAVRWIAPQAENHASAARLAPFALFVPLAVFIGCGAKESAAVQFAVAAISIGVSACLELMTPGSPMVTHLRAGPPGAAGRFWVRWFGLPGWPSAILYLAAALAVLFALATWWSATLARDVPLAKLGWLLVLGWSALATPALVLSFFRSLEKATGAVYFVVQGACGVIAALAANHVLGGASHPLAYVMEGAARCLPVTNFWMTMTEVKTSDTWDKSIVLAQGVMTAGMVLLAWRQGRDYWRTVRTLEQSRARAATEGGAK